MNPSRSLGLLNKDFDQSPKGSVSKDRSQNNTELINRDGSVFLGLVKEIDNFLGQFHAHMLSIRQAEESTKES